MMDTSHAIKVLTRRRDRMRKLAEDVEVEFFAEKSLFHAEVEAMDIAISAIRELDHIREVTKMIPQGCGQTSVFPCRIGDQVWLTRWWDALKLVDMNPPVPRTVSYFRVNKNGVAVHFRDGCVDARDFGTFVFLSYKEAKEHCGGAK